MQALMQPDNMLGRSLSLSFGNKVLGATKFHEQPRSGAAISLCRHTVTSRRRKKHISTSTKPPDLFLATLLRTFILSGGASTIEQGRHRGRIPKQIAVWLAYC